MNNSTTCPFCSNFRHEVNEAATNSGYWHFKPNLWGTAQSNSKTSNEPYKKTEKNCNIISYFKIPKIRDSIKLISFDVQELENICHYYTKNIYFDACAIVRAINFCFDTWPIVLLCFDMTLMSLLERCVFKASVLTPCNSSSKIRHCYFFSSFKNNPGSLYTLNSERWGGGG